MDDAKLNNITLQCETLNDSFEKALAKYEFPYRNEAMLEDMGQHARAVSLRCYFWDATYDLHKELVAMLYRETAFELLHPAYGLLKGSVESVSVRHDDRTLTAEVDITFIEGVSELAVIVYEDIQRKSEGQYAEGLSQAESGFISAARAVLGSEASDIVTRTVDAGQDILSQFTGISRAAREYVKKVDRVVKILEATLTSVSTPANALVSSISFATNLPGRVIGSMARVADRYSRFYDALKEAPDRFLQSYKDGITTLEDSLWTDDDDETEQGMQAAYYAVTACEAGVQAGDAFGDDEDRRRELKRVEGERRFDVLGNYIESAAIGAVMNIREIESALYTAREMIQAAIDMNRENQALKDMARALLYHVNVIKLEIERIVRVDLDNEIPLHLVCLKYGLPYRTADRILAINNIRNPNYVSGSVDIYNM